MGNVLNNIKTAKMQIFMRRYNKHSSIIFSAEEICSVIYLNRPHVHKHNYLLLDQNHSFDTNTDCLYRNIFEICFLKKHFGNFNRVITQLNKTIFIRMPVAKYNRSLPVPMPTSQINAPAGKSQMILSAAL